MKKLKENRKKKTQEKKEEENCLGSFQNLHKTGIGSLPEMSSWAGATSVRSESQGYAFARYPTSRAIDRIG